MSMRHQRRESVLDCDTIGQRSTHPATETHAAVQQKLASRDTRRREMPACEECVVEAQPGIDEKHTSVNPMQAGKQQSPSTVLYSATLLSGERNTPIQAGEQCSVLSSHCIW